MMCVFFRYVKICIYMTTISSNIENTKTKKENKIKK